jgi:hypothetical protein
MQLINNLFYTQMAEQKDTDVKMEESVVIDMAKLQLEEQFKQSKSLNEALQENLRKERVLRNDLRLYLEKFNIPNLNDTTLFSYYVSNKLTIENVNELKQFKLKYETDLIKLDTEYKKLEKDLYTCLGLEKQSGLVKCKLCGGKYVV